VTVSLPGKAAFQEGSPHSEPTLPAPRPGAYDFNVLSMLRKNRNAGGIPKGEVMTHRGRKLHTIACTAMAGVSILTLTPSQPAAQSKITVNQELKEIAYSGALFYSAGILVPQVAHAESRPLPPSRPRARSMGRPLKANRP
jgi:hypothetical protein